jgi:hypothetical protein
MKQNEIKEKLNALLELTNAKKIKEEITQLLEEMKTTSGGFGTKATQLVAWTGEKLDTATKTPPQMVVIYDELKSLGKNKPMEVQSFVSLIEDSGKLVTRQSPMSIFRYYKKRLEDDGLMKVTNVDDSPKTEETADEETVETPEEVTAE